MERCDFSSISTYLKNQISESNQMSQPDFLYELFEDFMNDPINEDFSMDNGSFLCGKRMAASYTGKSFQTILRLSQDGCWDSGNSCRFCPKSQGYPGRSG